MSRAIGASISRNFGSGYHTIEFSPQDLTKYQTHRAVIYITDPYDWESPLQEVIDENAPPLTVYDYDRSYYYEKVREKRRKQREEEGYYKDTPFDEEMAEVQFPRPVEDPDKVRRHHLAIARAHICQPPQVYPHVQGVSRDKAFAGLCHERGGRTFVISATPIILQDGTIICDRLPDDLYTMLERLYVASNRILGLGVRDLRPPFLCVEGDMNEATRQELRNRQNLLAVVDKHIYAKRGSYSYSRFQIWIDKGADAEIRRSE